MLAFGIKKSELSEWKQKIDQGDIAFLTHYWLDDRFPGCKTVTKVGCKDLNKLAKWGAKYGLNKEWIHHRRDGYSHFDLLGERQKSILEKEGLTHLIWQGKIKQGGIGMVKLGIIGLGDIAQKAYLPVISSMKNLDLHLFTRSEEKLEEISQKYRISNIHPNLKYLINGGINAAFVHSSTESHYEIVKELLLHDIHVYVDKPITYHYETAKELVELAESRNLILMTGFNRRFAPSYQALQDVVNPNFILMQKNRHSQPGNIRTFIFDDYIHVIDTVRFLMKDENVEFTVHGRKKGNELYHVAVEFFSNECTGIAIMNRDRGSEEERVEVMGPEEKRIVTDVADMFVYSGKTKTKPSCGNWETTLYKRGFEQIIAEFIYAVRTNSRPSITERDALKTHEICERIVQKLEQS